MMRLHGDVGFSCVFGHLHCLAGRRSKGWKLNQMVLNGVV